MKTMYLHLELITCVIKSKTFNWFSLGNTEVGTDTLTKRRISMTKFAEPTGDMLLQHSVVLKLVL